MPGKSKPTVSCLICSKDGQPATPDQIEASWKRRQHDLGRNAMTRDNYTWQVCCGKAWATPIVRAASAT